MANSAKRLFDELCPKIQGVHTFRNLQTAFFVVAKLVLLTFMAIIILLAASKYPATVPINVFEIDVLFREKTSAKLFCHLKWYSAPTYFKLYLSIKFFWINQETELYFSDFTKNETTIFQCRIVHQWMMYPFYWKTADFFSSFQRPHFQLPKFFSKFLNRSRSQESPSLLHLNDIWVQTSLTWFQIIFAKREDHLPIRCLIKLDPLP